mgnify:CR=1 FL=1
MSVARGEVSGFKKSKGYKKRPLEKSRGLRFINNKLIKNDDTFSKH